MDAKTQYRAQLPDVLPPVKPFISGIRRAPNRGLNLNIKDIKTALRNALRYIPSHLHEELHLLAVIKTYMLMSELYLRPIKIWKSLQRKTCLDLTCFID